MGQIEWRIERFSCHFRIMSNPEGSFAVLKSSVKTLRDQQSASQSLGFIETALPSVRLFWSDGPVARAPLSYTPGIAIIVSGRKIGFFEDQRIEYGPGQYLAVGLPLFFECETFASREEPLVGIFLSIEPEELRNLGEAIASHDLPKIQAQSGLGIEALTLSAPMLDAVTRLACQLKNPVEAEILGPNTLREVFFHALHDRHGRVLLGQTQNNTPEARIVEILRKLDCAGESYSGVGSMAAAAGMSPASLHRHFKAVTGLSPLQYQKRKRLARAKSLLVFSRMSVAQTARAVGYLSVAQFSRDFSAYYGTPPSRADQSAYPA